MLEQLQNRLKALVQEEPLLAGRPVLVEDKNNLVSVVETALDTQSLAVVIASASGNAKDGPLPRRSAWTESFDVVIHRGLVDAANVPSTAAVLDALRDRLNGAQVNPEAPSKNAFRCTRHELRENGDGTYARALTVAVDVTI